MKGVMLGGYPYNFFIHKDLKKNLEEEFICYDKMTLHYKQVCL